jgi:stage III sporulation protein AB
MNQDRGSGDKMSKIIGCILVIAATSMTGIRAASGLDEKYNEIKYIRQVLYILQSEIQYSHTYLAEAFSNIAGFVKNPYNVWLRQLHFRLERKDAGNLETVWRETIDEYLIDVKLPCRQKEQLKELGVCLGCADIRVQMKHMELLEKQLEAAMEEIRGDLEKKKKLCRCMGIVSGIFIVILLI